MEERIMSTIEKLEAARDECENQIITDGDMVWVKAFDKITKAIEYQKAKSEAALKTAYS
jgi:hypothetical protein